MTADHQHDTVLRCAGHVLSRRAGEETVLMNLTSEMYFSLSGVGADFWELVEQETSFDAAVQALLDRYDVSADVLRSDLRLLADELFAQGLIEETEAQR